MNDFVNDQTPKVSCIIHKSYDINADTLKDYIKNKIPDKSQNESYELVYVYYLVSEKVRYPCGESGVLYIGKTNGQKDGDKKSAAFRFVHLKKGRDYKQNITLGKYYEKDCLIGLDIFEVDNCTETETKWRYSFLSKYGALPVADGASYSSEKNAFVNKSTDEMIENNI